MSRRHRNGASIAGEAGARAVILNAEPTEMDSVAEALLRRGIADILPVAHVSR